MIDKAPDAYRTISEVAEELDLPQHVLRFWETRFAQIKPLKRGGGRRYYRPDDVELLKGIRHLLYSEGYTIKGVQRILKEQGPKAVQALVQSLLPDDDSEAEEAPAPVSPVMRTDPPGLAPVYVPPPSPPVYAAPRAPQPAPAAPPPAPVYAPPPVYATAYQPPPVEHTPAPPLVPHPQGEPDLFNAEDIAAMTTGRGGYSAVPPPPPVAPPAPTPVMSPAPPAQRQGPSVAFMRGGLSRPQAPAPVQPMPAVPAEPPLATPSPTFNVRRTLRPSLPVEPDPAMGQRYAHSPLVEPDLGGTIPLPETAPARHDLSDEGRRALQSALFELTECRRTIERVIASRGR